MVIPATPAAAAAQAAANPISFHLWTFIFQVINVLVVMFVLYKLLFKPLSRIMAQREQHVNDSLDQAEADRRKAGQLLAEYQKKIDEIERETERMLAKATKEAEEYRRSRRLAADEEYQKMIDQARRDIEAERERAVAAIRKEMAALAVMAAGKVIEKSLNEEDHRRLVDDIIVKVGETQ
ncbi:MAG TPA: F0F1 ATP synthase subunit B [Firmicutes bacterium]|nr:F0F1 ATP synthase subunit B [Bacillota bacterium]